MATKPTQKDIFLLTQRPDLASKFDEVYGNGAAAEVLLKASQSTSPNGAAFGVFPQMQPQRSLRSESTPEAGSYTGAAIRGLTPPLATALMGAPFGPVGMLAGSLALPAGDALTALFNTATAGAERVTGGQYGRVTPPSQAIQNLLTQAGVPKAETTGQRALETGLGAVGGTASQMAGLQRLAQTAVSPVTRAITQQMAQRPVAQTAVALPAGAAGQVAAEAAQPLGTIPSMLASMGTSVLVGGAGMGQRGGQAPTGAEARAASIADKARRLGFTGETALTPAQAGTSRTANIFEAAASSLPFSAGQFTRRYGLQSDYAQSIINKVADIFGGMPAQPDTAFSSGASAVKSAAQRNVEKIGSGIREVASQTDIDLAQVPKFQDSILNARKLLSSIPPALRKDPLFESFEQFYFGKPNEELKAMVDSALKQAGLDPTKPNYKAFEASFRKQLVDSGIPEFEFLGYQQKGSIAGNDYQDQRQLFSDLAYNNKGTKVGEAFRALRTSLDDARDETFRAAGLDDQITKLKELRGSYGEAKDLNDRLKNTTDKTAVNYIISNQDSLANKVLPLMSEAEKRSLSQAILADIQQSSMFPTGEMDITKFGRNLIKDVKASPTTLPQILGRENAQTLTDLAEVAQSALKAKIPTSGTSERAGMMGLLTSMPAKFGASVVGGTALTGEPVIGPMLSLGVPPLATRAYLSPAMQNIYGNTLDPLFNYMAAPVDPMLRYMGGTGLLNTQTAQPEPYRIELNNMLPSRQ
jgi:hypothetical protein